MLMVHADAVVSRLGAGRRHALQPGGLQLGIRAVLLRQPGVPEADQFAPERLRQGVQARAEARPTGRRPGSSRC